MHQKKGLVVIKIRVMVNKVNLLTKVPLLLLHQLHPLLLQLPFPNNNCTKLNKLNKLNSNMHNCNNNMQQLPQQLLNITTTSSNHIIINNQYPVVLLDLVVLMVFLSMEAILVVLVVLDLDLKANPVNLEEVNLATYRMETMHIFQTCRIVTYLINNNINRKEKRRFSVL